MTSQPTACPTDYAYALRELGGPPTLHAETLYVVGGLYGNPQALLAVLVMREEEESAGVPVRLVFNGDFNWFNTDPRHFRAINEAVLAHPAIQGNVEAELAREDGEGSAGEADCGCAYPAYVEPAFAERSNRIFAELNRTARAHPALRERLGRLPKHMTVQVGPHRIGIVHGDPESLSGWRLAEEALRVLHGDPAPPPAGATLPPAGAALPEQTGLLRIEGYFRQSGLDAFASTHTCLPCALDVSVDGNVRMLVNNGSAGMPNFRGMRFGLLTRISARPAVPAHSLYGIELDGVRYDTLPIRYDHEDWLRQFQRDWPPGSPAHVSYFQRILDGPDYTLAQAMRGGVRPHRLPRTA